jgi:hypothetical protein
VDSPSLAGPARTVFFRSPLYVQLSVLLSGVCLLVACVGAVLAWQQQSLFDAGSPTPTPIRAVDLGAWAAGDNVHVTVTEFGFGESYVTRRKQNAKHWEGVWVPLLPPEGRRGIRVVAYSSRVTDEEKLAEFVKQNNLTGILSADRSGMPVKMLEENYPDVDFSRTMVLAVDRKFPRPAQIQALLAATGVMAVATVAGLLLWVVRWRRRAAARLAEAPLFEKAWLALFVALMLLGGGAFCASAFL